MNRRFITAALAAVVFIPGTAPAAGLDPCTKAVATAVEVYAKTKQKTIAKCEDKRSRGKLDASVNCQPLNGAVTDPATDKKLMKAAEKVQKKIAKKCTTLPPLGPACDSATTVDDLVACITATAQDPDVENINVDTLMGTLYGTAVPISDAGLQKCQAAISKEAGKYLAKRMKTRRTCETRRAKGKVSACPDAKAAAALEKARSKMDAGIRKKCTEAQLAAATPPNLDFGTPCETYKLLTFMRSSDPLTPNDNVIPVLDRFVRCITDATAGVADRMAAIALPAPEQSAFAEGVAAGDATDSSAVFWTRLPDPSMGGSLDVSTDSTFTTGVQTIAVSTVTDGDGTVKADVTGLAPHTKYFYRFRQGTATSRVGQLVTAPLPADDTTTVRLGWSGDSNAFNQPFTSLDAIRQLNLDAWLYIGDTIYGDDPLADGIVAQTIPEYEAKYRANRRDAALRNIMAAMGTYSQWDDHEVRNDFAGAVPIFASRMAAGNFAFRRYQPIREDGTDPMRLFRSFQWGSGVEFFLLDDRQHRSAKFTCCTDSSLSGFVTTDASSTCPGGLDGEALLPSASCASTMADPSRTILGTAQKQWLKNGLLNSTATFKFIMNGPPITELLFDPYDRWEGWPAERSEILDFIQSNNIKNVIWLSTDLHAVVISPQQVDTTHQTPELVSGSIGEQTLFRELPPSIASLLPSLPGLITQVSEFDLDRFNVVLITVTPGSAATAQFDFLDRTGAVIHSVSFNAAP